MQTITDTKLIYSAFSGTFYEIPEKDFPLLDMGQIPLSKKPKNCKKCFDRGNLGRDNQTFQYSICNCVKKSVDLEEIKKSITDKIDFSNLK